MRRLSEKEENNIISWELEQRNIESFKKILSNFNYTKATTKRILNTLDKTTRTEEDNYINELYKLNSNGRAWFEITKSNNIPSQEDPGWRMYIDMIIYKYKRGSLNLSREEVQDYVHKCGLDEYSVYMSGRVLYNKQEYKLFKFLRNKGILTENEIKGIAAARDTTNPFMCISRNPIDLLFCSTNQSFGSCESLFSTHSGAFYLGLGALPTDPNRCMLFITTKKLTEFYLKKLPFNHFRYIQRSWGILLSDDKLAMVRYYPKMYHDFVLLLQQIGFQAVRVPDDGFRGKVESKFSFKIPRYRDGRSATIFNDFFGLDKIKNSRYIYRSGGSTGCFTSFRIESGFETVTDSKMFRSQCGRCGNGIEVTFRDGRIHNGSYYCKVCFKEMFKPCHCCGKRTYERESFTFFIDDKKTKKAFVCNSCVRDKKHEKVSSKCKKCGTFFIKDDKFFPKLPNSKDRICIHCFNRYYGTCNSCGAIVSKNEIMIVNGKSVCVNCAPVCTDCNDRSEVFTVFDIDNQIPELFSYLPPFYIKVILPRASTSFMIIVITSITIFIIR